MGELEQLTRLSEILNSPSSEESAEQDEFLETLKKIPADVVSVTNIGTGGTLLQRAVRLEKATHVGWILDLGVDPKALAADGEVHDPDDDDVVNISPLSLAIKKNNHELRSLMMKSRPYCSNAQFLEQLFDIIEWVGPSAAKSTTHYEDFKQSFRDMLIFLSVQEVNETCIRETGTLLQQAVRRDCGYFDYVEILLDRGVDPSFVPETGKLRQSPIEMAAEMGSEPFCLLTRTKLALLMNDDKKEEFAKLLPTISCKWLEVTSAGENGTLLQDAILNDKQDFVLLLLKHGVDPLGVCENNKETPVEIALSEDRTEVLPLLAEYIELHRLEFPESAKLEYLKLMMESEKEVSLEEFKKHLQSLPLDQLKKDEKEFEEQRQGLHLLSPIGFINERKVKGTWVQYLATKKEKTDMLEILLELGFDPNGVTEKCPCTAMEIAAMSGNATAFNLLAPHCKDELNQKLAKLVLLALGEKAPSEEFKNLFASIPLAEVKSGTVQGANMLQIFAGKGKTAYVAFLVEQGLDPEATTKDEPQPAMWHAWLYDRVATMAELAKHTEPSMDIRDTAVWALVEKERERGWQKEMMSLLQQQNKLLHHLVKSSGVDPNEILK